MLIIYLFYLSVTGQLSTDPSEQLLLEKFKTVTFKVLKSHLMCFLYNSCSSYFPPSHIYSVKTLEIEKNGGSNSMYEEG